MTDRENDQHGEDIDRTSTEYLLPQAEAMDRAINSFTHFQVHDEGALVDNDLHGNVQLTPFNLLQLTTMFPTQAEAIIDNQALFKSLLENRNIKEQRYLSNAVLIHSARMSAQAFDDVSHALHMPSWRQHIHNHELPQATVKNAAEFSLQLTAIEQQYLTVVQNVQRGAMSDYMQQARGVFKNPDGVESVIRQQALRQVMRQYLNYDTPLYGVNMEELLRVLSLDEAVPENTYIAEAVKAVKRASEPAHIIQEIMQNPPEGVDISQVRAQRLFNELRMFLNDHGNRQPTGAELIELIERSNRIRPSLDIEINLPLDQQQRRENRIKRKLSAENIVAKIIKMKGLSPNEQTALIAYYEVDATMDVNEGLDSTPIPYDEEHDPRLLFVARRMGFYHANSSDRSNEPDIKAAKRFMLRMKRQYAELKPTSS